MELELELGLALPNHNTDNNGLESEYSQKRVFLDYHNTGVDTGNLSLLSWSCGRHLPDTVDGGSRPPKRRRPHVIDNDDDCREIEVWPPTNSPPRHRGSHSPAMEQVERKSMHVKVKMEGIAIGRKVNFRGFNSYCALTNTLIDMFAKYGKIESREEYTLLYLDKDGDWMLVGDVEWEEFVQSARRVEILKNDNIMRFRLLSSKT
ncbi:auxin-responsive protein IAA28-like [Salvia divinorum]|uniref:Auxin-responsive protein n=1 Tax=Salvia divinorum TaxID=28513 RepID=A0ABD1FLV0_SALDI